MKSRTQENKSLLNIQYKVWFDKNKEKLPTYTTEEKEKFRQSLIKKLIDEMCRYQGDDKQKLRMMRHKYFQVKEQLKNIDTKTLKEIKDNVWTPQDKSDYRRIQPKLILISDRTRITKTNIFGEEETITYYQNEKMKMVWNVLSLCTSKARNDNVTGRNLRYIVIDAVSKKYLGVINIASVLPNLTKRNLKLFKIKDIKKKYWKPNGVLNNMATLQKCVATSIFGYECNGAKLLALLAVSKQVQDDWYQKYLDKLVSVDTTSLYGGEGTSGNETIYDGIRPIWSYLGDTAGNDIPYKPYDRTYALMNKYLSVVDNKEWFRLVLAQTAQGQNLVREAKNNIIKKVFVMLKIKDELKKVKPDLSIYNQEPRGVYLCELFTNSGAFLRGEITEDQLKPAFNFSNDFLIELWRFGYFGDTEEYKNPDIVEMYKSFKELRKVLKIQLTEEIKNKKEQLKTEPDEKKQKKIEQEIRRLKGESKLKENRLSAKSRIANNRMNRLLTALKKKKLFDVIEHINKKNSLDGDLVNKGKKTQKSVSEKSFIEYYIRKYKLQDKVRMNDNLDDWYGEILNLNWSQVKEKYPYHFD